MNERALKQLFDDLGRTLDRLGEALTVPEDEPLAVDGTIQRFEFTFELFWKVVRRLLASEGIEANEQPQNCPAAGISAGLARR
ncbi:MAG TPA: nucleotidyltransferase substrate binding protein [Geminicoccaceae bacterium]|jgi:nucleotidyltransferase substrate binding protein (TIGR01987 family)|nr:nucleotidyltransferase substrate binding protein [Geminicoccaceae bacterium]